MQEDETATGKLQARNSALQGEGCCLQSRVLEHLKPGVQHQQDQRGVAGANSGAMAEAAC